MMITNPEVVLQHAHNMFLNKFLWDWDHFSIPLNRHVCKPVDIHIKIKELE
jgi:hypothetical protein